MEKRHLNKNIGIKGGSNNTQSNRTLNMNIGVAASHKTINPTNPFLGEGKITSYEKSLITEFSSAKRIRDTNLSVTSGISNTKIRSESNSTSQNTASNSSIGLTRSNSAEAKKRTTAIRTANTAAGIITNAMRTASSTTVGSYNTEEQGMTAVRNGTTVSLESQLRGLKTNIAYGIKADAVLTVNQLKNGRMSKAEISEALDRIFPPFESNIVTGRTISFKNGLYYRVSSIEPIRTKIKGFDASKGNFVKYTTKTKNGIIFNKVKEKSFSIKDGRMTVQRGRSYNGKGFNAEFSIGKGGIKASLENKKGAGLIYTGGKMKPGLTPTRTKSGFTIKKAEKIQKVKLTKKEKFLKVGKRTAVGVSAGIVGISAASKIVGGLKKIKNSEDLNAKVGTAAKMGAGAIGKGITRKITKNVRQQIQKAIQKAVKAVVKAINALIPPHIKIIAIAVGAAAILLCCLIANDSDSADDLGYSADEMEATELEATGSKLAINGVYLTWPLDCECDESLVTSGFGYRSAESTNGVGSTNHMGIDLGVNGGTKIYAAADGVVKASGYTSSEGNMVIIDHDGFYTYYYHMQEASSLAVGDSISRGDLIGYVGSTGDSTGNHLHFGLSTSYYNDYIDPYDYLFGTSEIESASDLDLMAAIIYCEASQYDDEHEDRQAIASIIINRVSSSEFPDTLYDVITEDGAFDSYSSGEIETALADELATEDCYAAAEEALSYITIHDYLYFCSQSEAEEQGINGKIYTSNGNVYY